MKSFQSMKFERGAFIQENTFCVAVFTIPVGILFYIFNDEIQEFSEPYLEHFEKFWMLYGFGILAVAVSLAVAYALYRASKHP